MGNLKEIMQFRGKTVDTNMTKDELLDVIVYLAAEMNHYRQEVHDYSDVIYKAKVDKVLLLETHQRGRGKEMTDTYGGDKEPNDDNTYGAGV